MRTRIKHINQKNSSLQPLASLKNLLPIDKTRREKRYKN
jgi:hypothetical protein